MNKLVFIMRIQPELPRLKSARDVRLDFFRGLAMFIIFIAHVPGNHWFEFIPARFGFSSAAELFVFCSGLASSFAFGRMFQKEGYWRGVRRVLFRLWQVYWAHIGLALVMIALSVAGLKLSGIDYAERLGLSWLFSHAGDGFLKLMTLTFTPTFLDILPMYLVLLAMIPLVMALAKLHVWLALGALALLWGAVHLFGLNLPGGQSPEGMWFFNPFAWQLVFFTGFAFGMGWLKAPDLVRGRLFWLCVMVLVLAVPLNFWGFTEAFPFLGDVHDALIGPNGKTNLNLLLYLHFLASAYVVLVLVEPLRDRLAQVRPIILVGQQALAAFMASISLAWIGGMVLDQIGRGALATAMINLAGFAALVLAAFIAQTYKGGGKGEKAEKDSKAGAISRADIVPRAMISPAE